MKKLKVSLVVLGLLLTGFVAGFITNRFMIHAHIQRVQQMDKNKGFGQFLINRLDLNKEQEAQLKPVLNRYGDQFHTIRAEATKQRLVFTDALVKELTPLLNEDQLKELDRFEHFLKRGPGPPPRRGKHN